MLETDENFVSIGTALDPIEEDDVPKKKPITLADQIVVDEKGRRRFHGAFTGGFSAGYFNTVGSKEGWTPVAFKSTRSDRSSVQSQNVQDFMDDEDMGAFGIAPQILRATSEFEQDTRKRARPQVSDGPIPGVPVLEQLIQPVKDTVGVRILLKLGWRHGKGLGPSKSKGSKKLRSSKTTEKQKMLLPNIVEADNLELEERIYGCSLPPAIQHDQSSDSDSEVTLEANFAPEDTASVFCHPKENLYGLGYVGLDRNALSYGNVNLFQSELKFRVENKNLSIKGEAFGIGAFEDGDEEVYSREDISDYDFALETPDDRKNRRLTERGRNSKKVLGCEDCISGFARTKLKSRGRRYYPPPDIPGGFTPMHLVKQSRFQSTTDEQQLELEEKKKQGLNRHKLTLEERQILLNDAINRVGRKEKEVQPSISEDNLVKQSKDRTERLIKFAEILQAHKSNQDETVFQPFAKNPEKQDRYEKYTTLAAAGFKESLKDLQTLEMTEWEREREKLEFERASSLYKPMAGVISSRFVSAKSHDISNQVLIKESQKEKQPTEDPKVAANMNLFGKLTHEVQDWHPDRLLCKRFNVPHPYPDSKMVGITTASRSTAITVNTIDVKELSQDPKFPKPPKKSLFDDIDFSKPPPGLLPFSPISDIKVDAYQPATSVVVEGENMLPAQDEVNASTQLSTSKPTVDLFKEIFADTSESESEPEDENAAASPISQKPKTTDSFKSSTAVPIKADSNTVLKRLTAVDIEKDSEEEESYYGPRPPSASTLSKSKPPKSSSAINYGCKTETSNNKREDAVWVEKEKTHKKHKSHKRKKSKEKHKPTHEKFHKKHKHKKKSKRKSRGAESDTSDTDSEVHISEANKTLLSKLKAITNSK